MSKSKIGSLFQVEKEPVLFTFGLPPIEKDEETIQLTANQLKRIVGLVSVITTAGCDYSQIVLPHEVGKLESITFLLSGETDRLKEIFDGLIGQHENEIIDSHNSSE